MEIKSKEKWHWWQVMNVWKNKDYSVTHRCKSKFAFC